MISQISAPNIENISFKQPFEISLPDECPCCDTALVPVHLSSFYKKFHIHYSSGDLFSLFFCPKCDNCFLAHYRVKIDVDGFVAYGNLLSVIPHSSKKTSFSEKLRKLSPNFVNIYHQSEEAEACGLSEICGLGYRKALEFLVKDYAITFNPDKEESIKSKMLSPCINEYINSERIQTLAVASAWIGNDETHYVRKHEQYGIEHLKAFISAIVSYIDSELFYLEANALINKTPS